MGWRSTPHCAGRAQCFGSYFSDSLRCLCRALLDAWHELQDKRVDEAAAKQVELAQLDVEVQASSEAEAAAAAALAAAQKQAVASAGKQPMGSTSKVRFASCSQSTHAWQSAVWSSHSWTWRCRPAARPKQLQRLLSQQLKSRLWPRPESSRWATPPRYASFLQAYLVQRTCRGFEQHKHRRR